MKVGRLLKCMGSMMSAWESTAMLMCGSTSQSCLIYYHLWNFIISKKSYCYLIVYSTRNSIMPWNSSSPQLNSTHCFVCWIGLSLAYHYSSSEIADLLSNLYSWKVVYPGEMAIWGYQVCLSGMLVRIQIRALVGRFCSW